jgi:hypothetical protein
LWIYLGRFPSTERDGTSVFACWKTLMLVHVDTQNLMTCCQWQKKLQRSILRESG